MLLRTRFKKRHRLVPVLLVMTLIAFTGMLGCNDQPGPASYAEDADITWTTLPTGAGGGNDNVSTSRSFELDGDQGGTFEYHHLSLEFPPGAVKGRATVTITAPRPSRLIWDLTISKGASFKVPVIATITYGGMSEAKTHTMLWLDEKARKWVDIGGQDYPDRGMFQVELDHFSIYGLADGTSGWD